MMAASHPASDRVPILSASPIVAFVVTTNFSRAKPFYEGVLGLRLVSEDQFALVFDANGTMLRVTLVKEAPAARHTVLGWQVSDIAAAVESLQAGGIQFERYSFLEGQDEQGIWTAPGGARIAWCKDPDGNTLSLSQFSSPDATSGESA